MAENEKKTPEKSQNTQDVSTQARDVIEVAKNKAVASGEQAGSSSNDASVADSFRGLPMRELIAGPLIAAAEAQQKLASISWDFFQKLSYESDEKGNPKQDKTRLLTFNLQRPIEQDGKMTVLNQTVQAPFIGLLPIPSLLIDKIDVDFQMEVTATNTTTEKTDASVESKISARWWGVTAEVSGKVSTSKENTRSTNQTAKYQVHVSASQQPQTEGLSRLMDIMASCIDPLPVSSK